MSAAAGFSYDYVFNMVSRLTPEEQERLVREVNVSRTQTKEPVQLSRATDASHEESEPEQNVRLVEYTVPGEPIISAERLEEIKRIAKQREARKSPEELEENRQKLLEILLNCPVFTDEELKGFEEARKEINECRLAYL